MLNFELTKDIMQEVNKTVIGKESIVRKVLTAIIARGHILIEDIPGVGKTTLALAFSKVMNLEYNRLQFTPDVLSTDVIGYHVITKDGELGDYKRGPVVCNLFLADEINRTSSKTQSALLEVMEEGSVTVDGITMQVPKPFTVIATQNPVGSIGTHMLPESQLDRFMIRLSMGYPDVAGEIRMLKDRNGENPLSKMNSIVSREDILTMQQQAEKVFVNESIYEYLVKLILMTRRDPYVELGVSPRGSIALLNMAKANAYINGREFLVPDDIRSVFYDIVSHRIILKPETKVNNIDTNQVCLGILKQVQAPKVG
ncbi:AAA family ATPase [Anaerocolumna chitinilytica]|uniref:ATPase n=1 Tax=Anaerocolumna chitinilytica TaxID=1727145 RepID=A0A7I8DRW1_9FIRM|nr:MoxR family ATPase [Anaerocolumna chitinilytica]BCK01120.1 ATPase [Anaerocolumna chitinilytica]